MTVECSRLSKTDLDTHRELPRSFLTKRPTVIDDEVDVEPSTTTNIQEAARNNETQANGSETTVDDQNAPDKLSSSVRVQPPVPVIMKETEILKRRDPNEADINNWPCYVLTEATVHDPKTCQLTSLLSADVQIPLTVIGVLSKVKEGWEENRKHRDAELHR